MLDNEKFEFALNNAKEQIKNGLDAESLLSELRRMGADKIDSIKVVKSVLSLTMVQAKSVVDRSETWSDRYDNDRAFHNAAREAVARLKREKTSPEIILEDSHVDPTV